ncbi:CDGSH iron-sulfur domain-containing protein [Marinobacteraceae bacterium S3BR75-40.1]
MTQSEAPGPQAVFVESGKRYLWCACRYSRQQPFCDGSHQAMDKTPVSFEAKRSEWVWLCGCKRTRTPPLCDGTHASS